MKKYEKEMLKREREIDEENEKNQDERAKKFARLESNVFHDSSSTSETVPSTPSTTSSSGYSSASTSTSISNMSNGKDKEMPSFWTPASAPDNKKKVVEKPSEEILCPISGKVLKASKLISINFTPVDSSVKDHLKAQYKCAVTHDLLTNSSKCVVLKTSWVFSFILIFNYNIFISSYSGSVVTQECVDKLIKKDMVDPVNGKKMKPSDFIPLQQGGTGYSSANKLEAEIKRPSMMIAWEW